MFNELKLPISGEKSTQDYLVTTVTYVHLTQTLPTVLQCVNKYPGNSCHSLKFVSILMLGVAFEITCSTIFHLCVKDGI